MLTFNSLVASLALTAAVGAQASNIYFFGDSLSDTGNIGLIAPGNPNVTPQTPYQPGQFTDNGGKVWTAGFAAQLGQASAANPSLRGGNNFAIAGARTYSLPTAPIGLDNQLAAFRARNATVSADDLFVIMIGGNDLAQFVTGQSTIGVGPVLTNLSNAISGLYTQNNARHFLVANMPDYISTPFFQNLPVGTPAQRTTFLDNSNAARNAYNGLFTQTIAGLSSSLRGVDIDVLDFTKLDAINLASVGITNPTGTCFVYTGTAPAPNCSSYKYSDDFHPSSTVHRLITNAAIAAVPVPASALLLGLGFLGLFAASKKRVTA